MVRTTLRLIFTFVLALELSALLVACAAAEQTPSPNPEAPGTISPEPGPPRGAPDVATDTSLTVGTTEGPYYITGTAELEDGDLNATDLPGDPIRIVGHVYAGGGTDQPLANAKVEIWQADDSGAYHPNSGGDASDYAADDLALRGYVLSDADGRYEFTTIYPGYYRGRARHIHVRASADGFGGVTTQIIVPPRTGDGTTPDTDQIALSLPASHQVTFAEKDGLPEATFDFHLGPD